MTHILLSRGILGHPNLVPFAIELIKPEHKVLVVALSFFPHQFNTQNDYEVFYAKGGEYHEKMLLSFAPYGIQESNIQFLNYYKDDTQSALKKIKDADIIYLPGGAPDLMMHRITELGIKDALEQKTFFIGSSAGTMIQFETYHISRDHDYPKFSYQKGLNLLKGFSVAVHYRRRKAQKSGMKKVYRAYQHPIFVIPDDGAMIIQDDEARLINAALYYDLRGVVR
jgi:peptidase E